MQFVKYPSIENSYNTKNVNWFREHIPDLDKIPCTVEEKLHGANFSFHYNHKTGEVKAAKRTGFLQENENFYHCTEVINKYTPKVKALFASFSDSLINAVVYGELVGGCFPNKVSQYRPIQKGVYYTPDIEFVAFDIWLEVVNPFDAMNPYQYFTTPFFVKSFCSTYGIPSVSHLFKGTFEECLKFNPEFKSEMYKILRPDLANEDVGENIAEGGVIKSGLTNWEIPRVVLKIKGERWKEVAHQPRKEVVVDNEHVQTLLNRMTCYITENRLMNVLSHNGLDMDFKNFRKICQDYVIDLVADFEKAEMTSDFNLENEYSQAKKFLWREIENFVRQKILCLTTAQS